MISFNRKNNPNTEETVNYPLIQRDSGFMFSLAMLSLVIATAIIQMIFSSNLEAVKDELWFFYLKFYASSIALVVALLCQAFLRRADAPYLRIKLKFKTDKKYWLIAVLIIVGTLTGLANVNDGFIYLLKLIGYTTTSLTLPERTFSNVALCILVLGVLTAFFEEVIFRGCILGGIKETGKIAPAIVCGLLFSIFHMNPDQTIYQFILGAIYALLVLKSNSVLPAIFCHLMNNILVIVINYFIGTIDIGIWGTVGISAIGLCILALGIYLLFKKPKAKTATVQENKQDNNLQTETNKEISVEVAVKPIKKVKLCGDFWISAAPGLIIAIMMWIFNLFGN